MKINFVGFALLLIFCTLLSEIILIVLCLSGAFAVWVLAVPFIAGAVLSLFAFIVGTLLYFIG